MRPADDERVFFFIHVMKTAGGSFRNHLLATFGREASYPQWDVDSGMANVELATLDAVDDERFARLRAFSGHFPYLASVRVEQRLGRPVTRLTILRHPVDRTISLLGDMRHWNEQTRGRSIEQLYDDPMLNAMFVANHMTKIFALTEADDPPNYMHGLTIDDDRLALAQQRLATVDVVGRRERFDDFIAEVERRYGWSIAERPDRHLARGEDFEVSDSFRARIAEDNAYDMAFYDYATRLP
ncbi:MAG: sulfotransferase family 2 domain-containing protein [Acidimicrobiia bacterium]|nr:sulfotransferase family 2 domain-containing protein [Acidimicrobiia bacterium]MDH5237486.1 sulfotransferase family 2 domain-containing protein [Acidimicrobiia bacterium]